MTLSATTIANRVHDIFMSHVVLEGSGIMSIIGELVASRVPEHVGVDWERHLCDFPRPSDRFQETCRRRGPTTLGDKHISRFCILPA
jgi:hypothetical protein